MGESGVVVNLIMKCELVLLLPKNIFIFALDFCDVA